MNDEFWKRKRLDQMSRAEWESLCDGCALCCLQKIEDEESGEIFYTDIACKLLDVSSCRCGDYAARAKRVADCLVLTVDDVAAFQWLPSTCAYRRLAEGDDIPEWHPLRTGDPESVHEAGVSIRGKTAPGKEASDWTVLRKLN